MKIAVRLPNWLGDAVMSTAFLGALTENYPNASIDVILKKELAGIADLLPGVNTTHYFSKREFGGLPGAWRFGRLLRKESFDLFFVLPGSFSAAVMALGSGAKKRIGYRNEFRSIALTHAYSKPERVHRVEEYTSLLEQFTGRSFRSVPHLANVPRNKTGPGVLVNFNSEASSRRMPLEKARSLIVKLSQEFPGEHLGCIGSATEKSFIQAVLNGQSFSRIENLAGTTDLAGLARIIASAKVLLSTDSGPAHLANALGTPVIVLFGAGDERNTSPYNPRDRHLLRAGKLVCEPCVKNQCRLYQQPECMNQLNDLSIIERLKLYLPDVAG